MLIYGFGGGDVIRIDNAVTAAGTVNAGDGNDSVYDAGSGSTVISGGNGDDLLVSVGGGSDTLYGNAGFDSFWTDGTDTVGDASAAETGAKTVHSIAEFYQPYTNNAASDDYVSLEIEGQNFTDPTITGYAAGYANFANSPLFLDGPQFNDIDQGSLGDCYFLAALSALADQDPEIITQMITSLGDGTYAIRFYENGQEVYLRLDADLPVNAGGSLVYARTGPDGEIWVPMLEKAYAHYRYDADSYGSIEGGWMSYAFKDLTGAYTNTRFTGGSDNDMYNYLSDQLAAGHGVTLGTESITPSTLIVSNHAYTVMDTYTEGGQKYVVVYNVWGVDGVSSPGDRYDGLVTITIGELQDNFSAAVTTLT